MKAMPIRDHNGRSYESMRQMAESYGLNSTTLKYRLKSGMDLETALTKKKSFKARDHKGNEYKNIAEMAAAYGISANTLYSRLKAGWDVQKALETPCRKAYDIKYEGHEYTMNALAKKHGMNMSVLDNRLKKGMALENALMTPVDNEKYVKRTMRDPLGREFKTIAEMSKFYGISYGTLKKSKNLENTIMRHFQKLKTRSDISIEGYASFPYFEIKYGNCACLMHVDNILKMIRKEAACRGHDEEKSA